MSKAIKLLVVEDSEDDARLVIRMLRRGGYNAQHERVESAAAMAAALQRQTWDAIVSDYNMPGFSGLDALQILRATALDIPFILISGTVGEEIAVDALKAGANDYVIKNNLSRLALVLERELKEAAIRAEHRRVQRKLAESEHRLRTIIATEPECVKVVGADGRLLEMNPAGLAMLEADSLAAVQSRPLLEFLLPEHRAAFVALHQRVMRGESGTLEFEVAGLKGGKRWLQTHAVPLRDAGGGMMTLLGITRDVTARRQGDAALRESESRFRSLTELSSDWYWEQDEQFRFVDRHAETGSRSPVQAERFGKTRWEDIPDADQNSPHWAEHRATLKKRLPFRDFEYDRISKDGVWRYVSVSGMPIFDDKGSFKGYRGVGKDLTERRRTERELQQFRMAMDMSPDSIYITDPVAMRFVYANNAAGARVGYSVAQLLEMGPQDLLEGGRAQADREFAGVLAGGDDGLKVERIFLTSDGSKGWTELHRRNLRIGDRTLIVTMGRDITERKQADERIRRLNRVYAVLSGINALIVRVTDRGELYREACRIAGELGGFPVAWIGEVDPVALEVRPVAGHGTDERFLSQIRMTLREDAPEGLGVVGQAVRDRAPVISNDTLNDPRITAKRAVEDDTRSLAVLPLIVQDKATGVLVLHSEVTGFFDEEEMKLLRELAADISFAIDHIEKACRLEYLAYYDALTGLANRSLFHERLTQYLRTSNPGETKLALALMNVERFKTINDSLGRQAGDELLRQLAARLALAAQQANVARIGGDQFAIMLPAVKGRSEVVRRVERIWRECFAQPFQIGGTELRVSAKTGMALHPADGADAEALFANAEAALQEAQETGERHQFHTRALTEGAAAELALENKLRQAIEKEEFVLHYQPKVDLETRSIVGVEALIRWQSPELGLVPPMKFIPLMEETGLILEAGTWALKRASLDHRKWFDLGLKAPRVAVNVSPIQLRQRDFVGAVERAIIEGIAPTGIDLEITESLIMEDVQASIEKLKAVRGLGVSIAIDDFGTGYSSLGYLAKLPVQTLKIDRSFIITMLGDPDTMTLVSTIISLAHSLRLKVVAEGVDAEEQAKMLRLLRCDEMQGYLYSKPVPFEQMTALLMQEKKT